MSNESEGQMDRGLIAWFSKNHVAANILMIFFIVGGFISISAMRTETFPSIDPGLININVPYPGATPYEVEAAITSRIEDALQGIEGVKRITSTATEGSGSVNVEIKDFADADLVYNDVETAINALSLFPPEDAERPTIARQRVTPGVMTLAIFGDVAEATLRYWADRIEDELQLLEGVSLTNLRGIRDYQISIEVPQSKLRQYNLSLEEVGAQVNRFSTDIPAGTVESEQGEILLRVQERRYTEKEFSVIPIRSLPDGSVLRLGDIATINDGFEDTNVVSKFNGSPAAFIDIKRSDSQDTLKVASTIKEYLKTLSLPDGLHLSVQQDETIILKDRINLMVRNAILGFILVFLILLLFLDLKLAIWTSAAIPISFLGGMMILHFMGYSLNMISLFALIVVLGIVVDDGVVTGESIFEEQEKSKNDPLAALRGVRTVLAPVTVGVATTMAAFAPLLFSTGTLGQIVSVIPAVVIPILGVSLIEAYFILPAHLSNPTRWSHGWIADVRNRANRTLVRFVEIVLIPFARFALRWRYATLAAFSAVVILTAGLLQSKTVRFIFFPEIEADTVKITMKMPLGTPFERTVQTVEKIEDAIGKVRAEIDVEGSLSAIESISVNIGSTSVLPSGPSAIFGGSRGSHLAEFTLQLLPSDFRAYSASDIERKIRARAEKIPGIEELTFQSSLAGTEADIDIELSHPDESLLIEAAEAFRARLAGVAGAINVSSSFDEGKTEYLYRINEEGAAVGLTPEELGRQLRSAYFGLEVQRLQRGSSEVIVYVRYPKSERENLTSLRDMRIRLASGMDVPLGEVTHQISQTGFSQIKTVNGRRIVSVTADANAVVTTPNEIIALIESDLLPELNQRYPELSYNFGGETRDQAEDLKSLGRNLLIALMIIYIILGGQLRSYLQPFIIMIAIPFGVAGAILGHFFLGHDLTFISLFGVVALTGVVVNDSVVLMDYLNTHHRSGTHLLQSSLEAIRRRFRPIMLTTLSTCLGLLPMLLETSLQARFLIPMVVSLSSGIIFATPVILILVPSMLLILDDLKTLVRRMAGRV